MPINTNAIHVLCGEFKLVAVKPKTESVEAAKMLSKMLDNEEYIEKGDSSEFSFLAVMRKIPKTTMDDLQAWAFYHACKREQEEALRYFKRSVNFDNPEFFVNYLYYLIQIKEFAVCEKVLNDTLSKYPSGISAISEVSLYIAMLNGNIAEISKGFHDLIKLKNSESDKYQELKDNFTEFMDCMKFGSEDLKALGDIYKKICKKYEFLTHSHIGFESYAEYDVNAISFSLKSEKYADLIPDLNNDLAHEIANNDRFNGKAFSATFDVHYGSW